MTLTAASEDGSERARNQNGKTTAPPHETNGLRAKRMKTHGDQAITQRPKFDSLPLREGDPKASAWGLWGEDDELGTLNLLTPAVTKAAAEEIQLGRSVPLNLPLDHPLRPMNPLRKKCCHKLVVKGYANDDELDINTQSSTHWDGLRHYPYQESLLYYNGVTQADISGPSANSKIGIQNLARKAIAGRGVLLDWRSYALRKGITYSPFTSHEIPLRELLEVAKEEGVTFRPGDVLIIRSGFTEEYNKLSPQKRDELGLRETRAFCGVEASKEMIEWHWNNAFAAVAGDTNAYEAWPSKNPYGLALHEVFLSGWGMPIGEVWDLEELARICAEEKRWTFFLTSQPLNVSAGVASPANVMAIL